MELKNKTILVTGGTGTFGRKFVEVVLRDYEPKKIIVFSRDELKQHEMRLQGANDPRLRFFIGDVRDRDRLSRAFEQVDVVVHAAALKQIPACEYNPIEAIKTNVIGTQNVVEAALDNKVERVLLISSDKAVNPVNLYGATKLCAEKLFVQSNAYSGENGTRFSCVRYGNVVGSRGSVIPIFLEKRNEGRLPITDKRMTRFWLVLEQGIRFVLNAIEQMHGGEVFIPKIPSMSVLDLASAIAPKAEIDVIGIRPGEKLHEVLISEDEVSQTLEFDDMYVIQPAHPWWNDASWEGGKPLPVDGRYASDSNSDWLSVETLQDMVKELS